MTASLGEATLAPAPVALTIDLGTRNTAKAFAAGLDSAIVRLSPVDRTTEPPPELAELRGLYAIIEHALSDLR